MKLVHVVTSLKAFCKNPFFRLKILFHGGWRCASSGRVLRGTVFATPNLDIHKYVYVGPGCIFSSRVSVRIGAGSMIGPRSMFFGGNHVFDAYPGVPMIAWNDKNKPMELDSSIVVGRDCWIGASAIILGGSIIGDCAVVGAGSVVTKDVPPFCIVAGSPAKIVRMRFSSEIEREKHLDAIAENYDI
tara:strand:- start:41 stop:601 length:561 start_codon:yes stop_codon:yes gene_type:complete